MENQELELVRYNEIMNPELRYEDIYEAFELTETDKETIREIEEVDSLFKHNEENEKALRLEMQKRLETKNIEDRYNLNWILGQNMWKVLYVFLICLIISGCFILLFTGFSLSGKLEGLDKEEENYNESSEISTNNANKRGLDKK